MNTPRPSTSPRNLAALNPRSWTLRARLAIGTLVPTIFSVITALIGMGLFQRYNPTATTATTTTVALWFIGLSIASMIIYVVIGTLLGRLVLRPFDQIRQGIERMVAGDYAHPIPIPPGVGEFAQLSGSVNRLASELEREFANLEISIAQRTRDLEAARDIGQILASLRDVKAVSTRVLDLIRERFPDMYHVQVFLIDNRRVDAVLQASTGEVGAELLARGHRLEVGSRSVIGQVTARGEHVIALDSVVDSVHKRNELLPETRSELAVPLRTSEGIIGALDLQSRRPDAFSDAEIRLFQTIADQLSIVIQNVRLYEESQDRLRDIEELNRLLIGETWPRYVQNRRDRVQKTGSGDSELTPLQQESVRNRDIAEHRENGRVRFAVPIFLRDEVVGAVEWEVNQSAYTENTRLMATELVARLALAADNVRLLEQSRETAYRESLLNEISNKLSQQSEVAGILQTAVREVGRVLPVSQTTIRLTRDS